MSFDAHSERRAHSPFVGSIGEFTYLRSPPAPKVATTIPFALSLVVITLFVPPEFSFYILGLRLTLSRLFFLIFFPALLIQLVRKVSAGRYRFVLPDMLVILTGFWMILAPAMIDGFDQALNHAGPLVLEFCVAYLATRVLLSEHGHALIFNDRFCRITALIALAGLLDTLTGHYLIHSFSYQLTGYLAFKDPSEWEDAYRLGLLRATGPIEHPILFGFVCVVAMLLATAVPVRWRSFVVVSCSLGAIFSFSSAAIQCVVLGFGLLLYERVTRGSSLRWIILLGIVGAGVLATFIVSNSPIGFINSHLIFSPESGYYREWTWDRVTYYVGQSPWFGLGFGQLPEEIAHSIDSLWLILSIQSGVPGAILFGLSLLTAASLSTSGRAVRLMEAESTLGATLGILIFLILFMAFTVHFWGIAWILTGLLVGMKAHLRELGALRDRVLPSSPVRRTVSRTGSSNRRAARHPI